MSSSENNQQSRTGERRQATVMFADLAGFTSMSEKLDHEEVTSLMNDCFGRLGTIIKDNGGTIDKFIGDCIMAVFGVPRAIEHAPHRAIRAALEMRERLYRFNEERNLSIPLDIHIGINSGEVLAGEVGTDVDRAYTVMGDAVNLASRLEDASETGQILVGPLTFRYTRNNFRFNPLKPFSVKGKEQPVQVYEVVAEIGKSVGVAASAGSSSRMERKTGIVRGTGTIAGSMGAIGAEAAADRIIQSELVGREKELARLQAQLKDAIEGSGSIVNVFGEAGIGKSRLCAEFASSEGMEQVTFLEGRALSVGRTLSYYPIVGVLKHWVAITEEDTEEQALTKLEAAIRTVAPEQTDDIFPYSALLMGYSVPEAYHSQIEGVSEESLGKIIAKNLKDLIIKACEFKPIVFMFEDMHWADESTMELLISLVGLSETVPVMFVLVYRPGYEESSDRMHTQLLNSYPDRCIDIELTSLNSRDAQTLAFNLLRGGGFPKQITQLIISRSEGNPFFIEEVIRSLIDTGMITVDKQGFEVQEGVENVEIPHNVNEVIMARIDRLDEESREILRAASVIGRAFFYRILLQVLRNEGQIHYWLDQLKEMQLIRERIRLEELEYIFKHALAQETVYKSILLKKRKEMHLNVARAIEEIFPDRLPEFYGMLAFHYTQGENLDKAEEYLEKAGAAALESAASSEALVFFQQALSIYKLKVQTETSQQKLIELEKNIAQAFYIKGLYVEAIHHYDVALEYLGRKTKSKWANIFEAGVGFLSLLIYLYLPFTRSKKEPDKKTTEILHALYNRNWAVTSVDATELFIFGFITIRLGLKVDILRTPIGRASLISISQLLCVGGISFRISKKILDILEQQMHAELDVHMLRDAEHHLELTSGIGTCCYDETTVDLFVRKGHFSRINLYLHYWGLRFYCKGQFQESEQVAKRAEQIGFSYTNDSSLVTSYEILSQVYYYRQKTQEGLKVADRLIVLSQKIGEQTLRKRHAAYKLNLFLQSGNLQEAEEMATRIKSLIQEEKFFVPNQIVPPLIGITAYLLYRFEKTDNPNAKTELLQEAKPFVVKMLRFSKKNIYRYAGACRLAGIYHWYRGHRRKAFKWWSKGLQVACHLDLKPELGRVKLEIGSRLMESTGQNERSTKPIRAFNGLPAQHYIQEARKVLIEIGMEGVLHQDYTLP